MIAAIRVCILQREFFSEWRILTNWLIRLSPRLLFAQHEHVWYQNDGNNMSCRCPILLAYIKFKKIASALGRRWRSHVKVNGHKNELMFISCKLLHQGTIQYAKSNEISIIDLEIRSKLHGEVKCHRRGGICVLWMLLVFILIFS